jgi:hypothetical protein
MGDADQAKSKGTSGSFDYLADLRCGIAGCV